MKTNWEEIKDWAWSEVKTDCIIDVHRRLKVADKVTRFTLFWGIKNQTDTVIWLHIRNKVWRKWNESI